MSKGDKWKDYDEKDKCRKFWEKYLWWGGKGKIWGRINWRIRNCNKRNFEGDNDWKCGEEDWKEREDLREKREGEGGVGWMDNWMI